MKYGDYIQKATVSGLEMFCTSKGINLRCDGCGEKFIPNPDLRQGGEAELRKQARRAGWRGPMTRESDSDMCPACVSERAGL